MKISRDEYLGCLTFKEIERPYLVELFGPLVGLDEEWRSQGASEEEISLHAFGFDWADFHEMGVNTDIYGGFPLVTLEENDEFSLIRDELGREVKLIKKSATIGHPLTYPVTDMDSWLKIKPFYEYSEERFQRDWLEKAIEAENRGAVIRSSIPGGFDLPRQLMGEERLCFAYYDSPELVHDILDTVSDMAYRILEEASREVPIHILKIHEDMAGKGGPLIGPSLVEEFIKPYYRRIGDMLKSRGTLVIDLDSDGDMNPLLESFIDCGVNMMHPMEPAAGMDMVRVREKCGNKLAISGGIDKFALLKGKKEIRDELEYKLSPSMRESGVLFGLDHRIPNGVSIDNYRYYVKTAREILGLPGEVEKGWARMAD